MSLIFDDEENPTPFGVGENAPEEVIRKPAETPKKREAIKRPVEPSPVLVDPSPPTMTEDRSALRFNVLLRRFIINGYRMESMLGKFRVWRGDQCLSKKWSLSFVDAITEIEPELLNDTNYPNIGKTLYREIGELKSLLQEVVDENISEGVQTDLRDRIETKLKEC